MKPKDFPLFEVRPYDSANPDKSAPSDPQLFTDIFDARIIIRDKLGRKELPTDIRSKGPSVPYPPLDFGRYVYRPGMALLFAEESGATRGQILIAYALEKDNAFAPPTTSSSYFFDPRLVKLFRQAAGLSMESAAISAGYSIKFAAQAWYPLENVASTRAITEPTAEKVANLFEVHPRQLLLSPHNVSPAIPPGVPATVAANSLYTPLPAAVTASHEALREAMGYDRAGVAANG